MDNKIFTLPHIKGMSVVVPKKEIAVEDLGFENTNIEEISKITGVHSVRQAAENETPTDYCISAAEHLFEKLNFDKSKIDGVVFATLRPDYISPGSGYVVQGRLNLSEKCIVVDINQACAGFVYGLFQAFLMIQSGYCKNVLVCAGEIPSRTMHPKDKSLRAIMSDAGATAIVTAENFETPTAFSFFNEGKSLKAIYIPAGGARMSRKAGVTDVEKEDKEGNIRTLEHPHMDGLELMSFAIEAVPKTVDTVLKNLNWTKDEVNLFAFHQANELMVKSIGKRLRVPFEKIPVRISDFGNTACASIPLTLCLEKSDGRNFDKTVMSGFGNGLACATVATNLENTSFFGPYEF